MKLESVFVRLIQKRAGPREAAVNGLHCAANALDRVQGLARIPRLEAGFSGEKELMARVAESSQRLKAVSIGERVGHVQDVAGALWAAGWLKGSPGMRVAHQGMGLSGLADRRISQRLGWAQRLSWQAAWLWRLLD